jgi:lipopolysaccharide export system protein LptC
MAGWRSIFSPMYEHSLSPVGSSALWHLGIDEGQSGYDIYVRWMRLILSVVSLGLAATLLLWPVLQTSEVSFVLSYEDISPGDDQIRMTNPRYVGTDSRDRRYTVSARSGVQPSPDEPRILLQGIVARLDLAGERAVEARSSRGFFETEANRLALQGDVRLVTTDGYRVKAGDTIFDMNNALANSALAVSGSGPVGVFEADSFEIRVDERVAIFNGRVRVRIDPLGNNEAVEQ